MRGLHFTETRVSRGLAREMHHHTPVFKTVFTVLAFTFGIVTAIAMGCFGALTEFFVLFMMRPALKLWFRMVAPLRHLSLMFAHCVQPLAALVLPWNKN